jgi:hypothetical protein
MHQLSISTNQSFQSGTLSPTAQRYPSLGSPNNTSPWAVQPVISTSQIDEEEMMNWCRARGFSVDDVNAQRADGVPPGAAIHVAAFEGSVQICRWLSMHGADLGLRVDHFDNTPMHYAMWGGSQNVCIFLLKHGRAMDLKTRAANGKLPVDYAKEYGHIRLIRWMSTISKGEDWSADAPGQSITELALCPPPKAASGGKAEEELSTEEKALNDKIAARKLAMEEAGLDSENFSGFN